MSGADNYFRRHQEKETECPGDHGEDPQERLCQTLWDEKPLFKRVKAGEEDGIPRYTCQSKQ